MRLRPEWINLLYESKFGVGVQSATDLDQLDRLQPGKVLFLAPEFHFAQHYGPRAAMRTPHHDKPWWTDPEAWAAEGANNLAIVYPRGVRDYQPINEVWGIEGLSDLESAYEWVGTQWAPRFLNALESELHARGIPLHPEPDGVRVWLFAPSPGRNYEDNFVGLRHLAEVFRDPRVFGSIEHYYWTPDEGFFDGHWWAGPERLLRVRAKMLELGIDKPVWIGEWNRTIRRDDPADVEAYFQQMKRFTQWVNSLDYVVWATYFLWSCGDWATDFYDLTVTRTPDLAEKLITPWDRLSEGEWATPPAPEVPERPEFILGFKDYVGARDWTPLRDQAHDWTGDAWQTFVDNYGREGVLYWHKADDRFRHAFWED